MRCYGNVKGFTYRTPQPAPVLRCRSCGRKKPEARFLDGQGRRMALCDACRKRLERQLQEEE